MRIGDSSSDSYKRLHARRHARKQRAAVQLCGRLDRIVERAEKFKRGTKTRNALMAGAERVREKLRTVDH